MKLLKVILPLACTALIFVVDATAGKYWGGQTFAPACAVISLFGLAFVLPPSWILAWLPCFAAESYWLILDSSQYPITRTATVVVSGFIAAWGALCREKAREREQEIELILFNLPTPWVLIDKEGAILKTNSAGASWLGSNPEEIVGNSIFTVGADEPTRKMRLRDFIKLDDAGVSREGVDFPLGKSLATGKMIVSRLLRIPFRKRETSLLVLRESS